MRASSVPPLALESYVSSAFRYHDRYPSWVILGYNLLIVPFFVLSSCLPSSISTCTSYGFLLHSRLLSGRYYRHFLSVVLAICEHCVPYLCDVVLGYGVRGVARVFFPYPGFPLCVFFFAFNLIITLQQQTPQRNFIFLLSVLIGLPCLPPHAIFAVYIYRNMYITHTYTAASPLALLYFLVPHPHFYCRIPIPIVKTSNFTSTAFGPHCPVEAPPPVPIKYQNPYNTRELGQIMSRGREYGPSPRSHFKV